MFFTTMLVLGGALIFGGTFGAVYYHLKWSKEYDLRVLQYRNELINGLKKESYRRAKQRRRPPKQDARAPYIRHLAKRL